MTGVIDPANYETDVDVGSEVDDESESEVDPWTEDDIEEYIDSGTRTIRETFPVTFTYPGSDRSDTWDLSVEIVIDEPVVDATDIDIRVI